MSEKEDSNASADAGGEIVPVPDVLAPVAVAPAPVPPEMIVSGMQQLQERIPGFVQLSLKERRSMVRTAHLDPEFIKAGIHAAAMWDKTPVMLHRTAEEMREAEEDIRRWDDAIRSFTAILQGMTSANLTRKHRLGHDILRLYEILGILMTRPGREEALLRPYYEEMQRLYKEFAKPKQKKKKAGT